MTLDWLPNLFIAGVPKAGTSSLHRWLADHPDAIGAKDKEARYFMDSGSHIYRSDFNISNGINDYLRQFQIPEGASPRVILDSTPAYIYQKTALDHVPDLPSHPRCVFILREPAQQIRSLFTYFQNNWDWIPAAMSFDDYLGALHAKNHQFGGNELARDALQNARYVEYLRLWRDRLGPDRMLVCTFDQLRQNPADLTRKIAAWAGLDVGFYDNYDFPSENESYVPRWRLLQRANIFLRERLPKGAGYDALRSVYRRINTHRGLAAPDQGAALARLRQNFAATNADLAQEFGLDLSGWAPPPRSS